MANSIPAIKELAWTVGLKRARDLFEDFIRHGYTEELVKALREADAVWKKEREAA